MQYTVPKLPIDYGHFEKQPGWSYTINGDCLVATNTHELYRRLVKSACTRSTFYSILKMPSVYSRKYHRTYGTVRTRAINCLVLQERDNSILLLQKSWFFNLNLKKLDKAQN